MDNSFINTSIKNFHTYCERLTEFLGSLPDGVLNKQVAKGRNSGLYLVGHLVAVNDSMIPLFGLGNRQFPEFEEIFVLNKDGAIQHQYDDKAIIEIWKQHTSFVKRSLQLLTEAAWLDRHAAVSEADFVTQPNRNKLNVLIKRTLHLCYHMGQLALLRS